MEIREVRPEEYQRAGEVVVAAYQALPGAHMTGGYATELADVGRRAVEAQVLVAVDTEGVTEGVAGGARGPAEIVGCVTFVPDPSSPWAEQVAPGESSIRMLAVDPRTQSRGIGRSLLGACVERAVSLGSEGLFLHSTPWMAAAHRVYLRMGFARVPERDWLPVPEVPLIAFRLDLAASGRSIAGGLV